MAAALLLVLATAAAGARLGDLARRDSGDVFTLIGEECGAAQCAEHGAGANTNASSERCACACPQRAPLFREDRELCVDDLPECSLATFGTGIGVQRIPFVYLPLKGQIIHPSREITFQNVKTPICAVSGAQFLTRKGFLDLRNTLDSDVPFSLFRDEGRTFLQWSGEDDVRSSMSGRVMVVRLLCRDVAAIPSSPLDLRGVFTPCVAFRVQGSPPKQISNVTEVQFAPNAQTSAVSTTSGLSVSEYVAIGISSLLLGLIYVASVFLFLHIRKRRKAASESSETNNRRLKGLKKKDGTAITERDIIRINNERIHSLTNVMGQDDGVVKKNPLLVMGRQFQESKNSYPSDSGSNLSDSEDFPDGSIQSEENVINTQKTSAVVHLHHGNFKYQNDNSESNHRDELRIERPPDEHVSIVETTDDREIARPVGTTRRKLYFNPAYFEPQLMAEPPPAALEFLTKIREVISIAKHKMAAKRFHPVLNEIPEEETYPSNRNSAELYQGLGSQRSGSVVSLKRENSRKRSCVGCPGCKSDNGNDVQNMMKYDAPACSNCLNNKGDKQSTIQKWLENIPTVKEQSIYSDFISNQNSLVNSLQSLPVTENRCKIRKQNSFTATNSMCLTDNFTKRRKSSTMSVRSEPSLRNYNYVVPDFNSINFFQNNFNPFYDAVSQANATQDSFGDYRSGSLRSNAIANHRRNKFAINKNALPDMVNEAIALDHCSKTYNQSSSDDEKFQKKHTNLETRNNSESPVANDYETDSLERTSHKKGISTPIEYPDVPSSQASPSLSNALPLEEELTMRNAIYKHPSSNSNTPSPQRDVFIDQNHYETIEKQKTLRSKSVENINQGPNKKTDYSLVSEVYVNNNYNFGSTPTSPSGSECSMGSRKLAGIVKKNPEEKPGCLTIEVKDPPENYIKIHESDGFEPDTLDRKHPKQKNILDNVTFSRKDLLKNIDNSESPPRQHILLRSSGTFSKSNDKIEYTAKFNSLRNEFEHRKNSHDRPKLSPTMFSGSKSLQETTGDNWEEQAPEWHTEEGRILTLELRHSKRQRQSTPPTIKQIKSLARPDILPPLPPTEESPIYEQPAFPPRKVESNNLVAENLPKNVSGRSLSPRTFMKSTIESNTRKTSVSQPHHGPSCSPMRASAVTQSSGYENIKPIHIHNVITNNSFRRSSNRKSSGRSYCSGEINTNTFVKGTKAENYPKARFRRKKGSMVEDSGYLSSDSTSSRQVQRKIVVAKIVSCSESDDTENEARSESGAESVETHSVYFGTFRKPDADEAVSYMNNDNDYKGSSSKPPKDYL